MKLAITTSEIVKEHEKTICKIFVFFALITNEKRIEEYESYKHFHNVFAFVWSIRFTRQRANKSKI